MRRRSHAIQWTPEQLQQHKMLEHKLQRAHATAAQALIRLARLHPAHVQYGAACNELVDVVHSISLLIVCCDAIKASGFRPKYEVVNVVVGDVATIAWPTQKVANPTRETRWSLTQVWGFRSKLCCD